MSGFELCRRCTRFMSPAQSEALLKLGHLLKEARYEFVTITPASHERVLARPALHDQKNADLSLRQLLRDFFGWNKWVAKDLIPDEIGSLLEQANYLKADAEKIKSKVRVSTLESLIFFHSSFPTEEEYSVFFGPDSYRFVKFIEPHLERVKILADLGAGAGVGGIFAADLAGRNNFPLERVFLTDINAEALSFSQLNHELNGKGFCKTLESDLFEALPEGIDAFIANPPFIIDQKGRLYRDGGTLKGGEFSLRIVKEFFSYALKTGRPTQLLLYTGASWVDGKDLLRAELERFLQTQNMNSISYQYTEIDPDIFGEQLEEPEYQDVERIAAVGIVIEVRD